MFIFVIIDDFLVVSDWKERTLYCLYSEINATKLAYDGHLQIFRWKKHILFKSFMKSKYNSMYRLTYM